MTDDDTTDVTLLNARTVEPGYEEDFRVWAGRVADAASAFPGHLGGGLFAPATDTGAWVLIHRFRDRAAARDWTASPERAALFGRCVGHHQTEVARRELSGMETWFRDPRDTSTVAPLRWKTAVAAFIAVLPVSLVLNGLLGPVIGALPLLVRVPLLALLFSTLMTYVMVPTVTAVLRRWLYPAREGERPPR